MGENPINKQSYYHTTNCRKLASETFSFIKRWKWVPGSLRFKSSYGLMFNKEKRKKSAESFQVLK